MRPRIPKCIAKFPAAMLAAFVLAMAVTATPAPAGTATVLGTDVVFGYGQINFHNGSTISTAIIPVTSGAVVTFSSVTGSFTTATQGCVSSLGCISLNSGGNYNDPDGNHAQVSSSSSIGAGSISGILLPGAGELVGVFVAAGTATGTAPAVLDFTGANATAFLSLSPLLNQTFFIGDGLTGDGTGTIQQFIAPLNAAQLVLGISDAQAYNGQPLGYYDNIGSYAVTYTTSGGSVPEPPVFGLFATGLGCLAAWRRRGVCLRR